MKLTTEQVRHVATLARLSLWCEGNGVLPESLTFSYEKLRAAWPA